MKGRLFVMFALLALAAPMFAAEGAGPAAAPIKWVALGGGFAMAIASAVCGLAQAKAVAAACEGAARNPGAAASIRLFLILGLALIESLALYTLVIVIYSMQ
jgi:F-type H+-transporting ATPase subunit c